MAHTPGDSPLTALPFLPGATFFSVGSVGQFRLTCLASQPESAGEQDLARLPPYCAPWFWNSAWGSQG